jgi:hypothetical protein
MLSDKKIYSRLVLSIFLITLLLSLNGCNGAEYLTFMLKKGIKFSFEYPSHYKKEEVRAYEQDEGFGRVTLFDKLPSEGSWYDSIYIVISDKRIGYTNPKEIIQVIITDTLPKEIIERSTVTMAGLQGELLVYSFSGDVKDAPSGFWSCSPSRKRVNPDEPLVRVSRVAYFDDGDKIWRIEVESAERKAEQAKADFEHILQTFKILN